MESAELYLALVGTSGAVAGDAVAAGHMGAIEISEWNWGLTLTGELSEADRGREGTSRAQMGKLTFKKKVDRSSTSLMNGAAKLSAFPKATITMLHRIQKGVKLTLTLEHVRIDDYGLSVTDSETGTTLEETIVVSFEKVAIEYKPRDTDGGTKPGSTRKVHSFELGSVPKA